MHTNHSLRPPSRGRGPVFAAKSLVALAGAVCVSTGAGARADESARVTALEKEIAELKAHIFKVERALADTRSDTRREVAKLRRQRVPTPAAAPPPPAEIPVNAVPAFVTASKQLQFGAITITPGGFVAAESVYRTRGTGSEIATAYNSLPFPNSVVNHVDEFRGSARQTRIALLAEAGITPAMLASGYGEFDFIAAAPTANSITSNSYQPRVRHLYANFDDADYGLHVLAGQNWSLLTLNTKGITPRNELTPPVIDASQMPGSVYARQMQIRLTKDFDRKLWLSLSLEGSETTNNLCETSSTNSVTLPSSAALPGGGLITCGQAGTGSAFASTTNYSFNHLPDVIGKVAYEATLGERAVHLEADGIYRDFYDRVEQTEPGTGFVRRGFDKHTAGYGVGAGLVAAIIPRKLDMQVNGLYGRGIARYAASALNDTTVNPDGSLRGVEQVTALVGVTAHVTPSIDIYGFAGLEKQFGTLNPGAAAFNDTGCFIEGAPTATLCNGATKSIWEVTVGMWDKLYKGNFGEVRAGLEYAYLKRGLYNAPGLFSPETSDHVVYTSLRYYPFQ